jgi:hypothetical protein
MNKEAIKNLIARPIAYHRAFAIFGGATVAIFLSQAYYWTDKGEDPTGWFYKTREEWERETGLTRSEQETARRKLRDQGIIQEKLKGVPCQLYFKVNEDRLMELLGFDNVQLAGNQPTRRRKTRKQAGEIPAIKNDENLPARMPESDQQEGEIPTSFNNESKNTQEITHKTTTQNTQAPANDEFDNMVNIFKVATGNLPQPGDVAVFNRFIKAEIIKEDIENAVAFFTAKGTVVRSAEQIEKSVMYSKAQRIQKQTASHAPGNNGHRSRSAPYIPGQARPGEKNSGELALDSENEFRVSQGLPKMTWDEYIARNQATQDARAAREAAEEAAREPEPVKKEIHPRDNFTYEQWIAILARDGRRPVTEEEYLNA